MINCKKILSCLFAAGVVFSSGMLVSLITIDYAYAKVDDEGARTQIDYDREQQEYSSSSNSSSNTELFSSLINTGRKIFNDLRELIYIVAGFGIIAVGVGGIFGNLNWKWLGAIIISLVIIATAGELITVMLGSSYGIGNEYTQEHIEATLIK